MRWNGIKPPGDVDSTRKRALTGLGPGVPSVPSRLCAWRFGLALPDPPGTISPRMNRVSASIGTPGTLRFRMVRGRRLLAAAWALIAGAMPGASGADATPGSPNPADATSVLRGSQLAHTYCVTCHLFPEPDAIDRKTWFEQVLPRMKYRLGFSTPELERSPNIRILREHQRIPAAPTISEAQWLDLAAFYLARSPEQALPQERPLEVAVGVPGFRAVRLPVRAGVPSVTAVKILPEGGALSADERSKMIQKIGRDGQSAGYLQVSNAVSSLRLLPGGVLAAALGSFLPSDSTLGGVFWLNQAAGANGGWQVGPTVLGGLPRTTDANAADLNGDGAVDYVTSCFGNNIGRMSWWEADANGRLNEHELFNLPGALRAEIGDFNGDGRPDIGVLVAQETEALFLFVGNGKGGFERQTVFQKPPYWGHSYFEVADFNRDGRPDFLVVNGDNGEFSSASKRYHGIRIYLAQAGGGWREEVFIPMYGAYKAVARDFDGDGDLDIAAISFFADFQRTPRSSFLYLQNQGGNRFKASTFAESATGRWLCMDAGDFDRDGDTDLLLGSYIKGPTAMPAVLMKAWEQAEQPLMLLENVGAAVPPGKPAGSANSP